MLVYDQWFFRLLMRRKRSQALFLNCAPEDVLSTTKVSLNTSEDQESLRHSEQCKVRWLPDVVWESQPKSTFSFPLWGRRTRKRRLKMRDLGFKPKQRDVPRSYILSFLWALCITPLQAEYFLGIWFTGWQTNTGMLFHSRICPLDNVKPVGVCNT